MCVCVGGGGGVVTSLSLSSVTRIFPKLSKQV